MPSRNHRKTLEGLAPELFRHPLDQAEGAFRAGEPCCVGARVAHALGVAAGIGEDYLQGANALARETGISRPHMILVLRLAGAPHDPFGIVRWRDPEAVWRRATRIECLPDLKGADLSEVNLALADLEGLDFTGASLSAACLDYAAAKDAVFEGADLYHATLDHAGFNRATLRGANLRGASASARDASFEGADLTRADLEGLDLQGACFDRRTRYAGTRLEGADLARSGIRLAAPGPSTPARNP